MATSRHAESQLALSLSRSLQAAMEKRNERVTRVDSQLVQDGIATGTAGFTGPGEAVVAVRFPISFVHKPVFVYGFELGPTSHLVQGSFPVGAAVVSRWTTEQLNDLQVYVGAQVAVVLDGITGSWSLDYVFIGRSIATPATGDLT